MLESEFSGRSELFSNREGLIELKDNTLAHLNTAFQEANGFANDPVVERFIDSIVFENDRDWASHSKALQAPKIAEGQPEASAQASYVALSAVLKFVEHMECFRQILFDFGSDSSSASRMPDGYLNTVKQRLKDIQIWRLNFADRRILKRFQQIARVSVHLEDLLHEDRRRNEKELLRDFDRLLRDLVIDWGAPPSTGDRPRLSLDPERC